MLQLLAKNTNFSQPSVTNMRSNLIGQEFKKCAVVPPFVYCGSQVPPCLSKNINQFRRS